VSSTEQCLHDIQKIIQEWLRHAGDPVNYLKKNNYTCLITFILILYYIAYIHYYISFLHLFMLYTFFNFKFNFQ